MQTLQILEQSNVKNSVQYTVLGFEHVTFRFIIYVYLFK